MKKILLKMVICCFLVLPTSAFASTPSTGYGNFYVKTAGPYKTSFHEIGAITLIQLELVDGGGSWYFRLDPDYAKEYLAVALTAISTGKPVRALIAKRYDNGHWSDYVVEVMFLGDSLEDLT